MLTMGSGQPHAQLLGLPDLHVGHRDLQPLPGRGPGRPVADLCPGKVRQIVHERPVLATSSTTAFEAQHGVSVLAGSLEEMDSVEVCHLFTSFDVSPSYHDGLVSLRVMLN